MRFDDFYYFAEGKREEQKLAREELLSLFGIEGKVENLNQENLNFLNL